MKERGILFSGQMVKAILGGRKTQTRRIVKLPKSKNLEYRFDGARKDGGENSPFRAGEYLHIPFRHVDEDWSHGTSERLFCPYGEPSDRLWVKETFQTVAWGKVVKPEKIRAWIEANNFSNGVVYYRAGGVDYDHIWRPSIFMPRWASRITLEITNIRVERLQEISEGDAIAEGVETIMGGFYKNYGGGEIAGVADATTSYMTLWDSINGNWNANPWVWIIDFKKINP